MPQVITKHTVTLYYDTQDPSNPGWAYRLTKVRHVDGEEWPQEPEEESGELGDYPSELGGPREAFCELEDLAYDRIAWTALPEGGWRGTWTERYNPED